MMEWIIWYFIFICDLFFLLGKEYAFKKYRISTIFIPWQKLEWYLNPLSFICTSVDYFSNFLEGQNI
jgi:hypothetical protein